MGIKELKNSYDLLAKKYKLPDFKEVNENFEIEKRDKESDILLKAIRKTAMEKIINSLGFLEMLLNPMNVPRMYMNYVRSITTEDKKDIDKIYDSFSALSLEALGVEIDYSEKGEAELIKKIFSTWVSVKPEFRRILANMKKPMVNGVKKEKSYFG